MVHQGSTDWLKAISMIELAINNSTQDSTGLSPAHIVRIPPYRKENKASSGAKDDAKSVEVGTREAGHQSNLNRG